MRIQVASGIFCVALLTVSCKPRKYNSGDVKSFNESAQGVCTEFVNDMHGKKVDAIFECESADSNLKVCFQMDKGPLGRTTYKVNYQAAYTSIGGTSYFGDTFSVPNLIPLDNLKTTAETPDATSLDVIAQRIHGNGNGGFGYLAETRLEFKNSFATVRAVRADIKDKNPTSTTPRDIVFALEGASCKNITPQK